MIARLRPAAAALAALVLAGCAGPRPLPGMDLLASARFAFEHERHEEALEFAEAVLEQRDEEAGADDVTRPGTQAEGEAAWIGAESALALGRHLKAFRLYKRVLESAPWLPQAAVIEERLYQIGLAFLYDDEYGGWFDSRARGVEVLETLQVHFRRSDLADDALRHVGDYFASDEVREYTEAALVYERLQREYPDSEWAERSLWLAGHCRLKSVPGPSYDREEQLRAWDVLRRSLALHPRGVAAAEAARDLAAVREMLARGEVLVADFYAGRGVLEGERLRLANAALAFPGTEAGEEARARLLAMGLDPAALAADPALASLDTLKARPAPESAP